jgi:rRNA maturation protein Rpf1
MYITSSRKPSLITKRLGRTFARLLPRGAYENRGKKNVDEIAARAKALGKSRALLIYENKGNPEKLVFMEIGKEWMWLSPQIRIIKLGKLPEIKTRAANM